MRHASRLLLAMMVVLALAAPAAAGPVASVFAIVDVMTPNGQVDTGEGLAVSFCIRNPDAVPTAALRGTLLSANGVSAPSAPQVFGSLAPGESACRTFTFRVAAACGTPLAPRIILTESTGAPVALVTYSIPTGLPVLTQQFDTVTPPALPSGWTNTASGATTGWRTVLSGPSAPNSLYTQNPAATSSASITTPSFVLPAGPSVLSAQVRIESEPGFDGGVLEMSIDGGFFVDVISLGGTFLTGAYTGVISGAKGSTLGGQPAWSGDSAGFFLSQVRMPPVAAGLPVRLRWRFVTDTSIDDGGMSLDSVSVTSETCAPVPQDVPWGQTVHVAGNEVLLDWNPPLAGGGAEYVLEASADGGVTYPYAFPLGSESRFHAVGPDGQFRTRVRAVQGGVAGPPSQPRPVALGSAFEPARARNLLAAVAGDTVTLAWNLDEPGGGSTALRLRAGSAPGLSDIATVLLPAGSTTFTAGGVPPGTYYVQVNQMGQNVPGDPSEPVPVVVPSACAAPGAPAFFTVAREGSTFVFTWELGAVGTAAPTSWALEAGSAPGAADLALVGVAERRFSAPIPPSGTYYVRVAAVNGCGVSPKSNELTLVVP